MRCRFRCSTHRWMSWSVFNAKDEAISCVFIFRKIQLVAGHIEHPTDPLSGRSDKHHPISTAPRRMRRPKTKRRKRFRKMYFPTFFIHGLCPPTCLLYQRIRVKTNWFCLGSSFPKSYRGYHLVDHLVCQLSFLVAMRTCDRSVLMAFYL